MRSLRQYDQQSPGLEQEVRKVVPDNVASLDDDAAGSVLNDVIQLLYKRRMLSVLGTHGMPFPRYPVVPDGAIEVRGPEVWDTPRDVASERRWNVLGFNVGFPIGIPSCELTSSADWIEYYARQGFNVLTYSTVRNVKRNSGRNWAFLDAVDRPWEPQALPGSVRSTDSELPPDWRTISTATPFSAPSPWPEQWMPDVEEARRRLELLGGRHLLIVSVTDSLDRDKKTTAGLVDDFVKVAVRAEQAGAQAIECYLARSTTRNPETNEIESCELHPDTSVAIVSGVRAALRSETKLVIKLSYQPSESLRAVVVPLARSGAIDGVSGISPYRMEVLRPDQSVLSGERLPGVAGLAIRRLGQLFVQELALIRKEEGLTFDILGMGGVMTPEDVATYRRLGACAVQSASAARCNPGLAAAAYAHYLETKATPEVVEDWEGVVDRVEGNTFVARLYDVAGKAPDEEAEFELDEVREDQLQQVRPGAFFWWRAEIVREETGERVRRSSVTFRRLPAPTEQDRQEGRLLVERTDEAFEPPSFTVD